MIGWKSWLAGAEPVERLAAPEAYERLAPDYDGLPNPMIALEGEAMDRWLPPVEGLVVADLGCGTGRYTARALAGGARRVYAVDVAAGMLRALAARLGGDPRVRPLRADLAALPLAGDTLDAVLCGLALGYAPRIDRALAEIARVLRPGGWAFLTDLHPVGPVLGWRREYVVRRGRRRERIVVEHHPYSFERFFDLCFANGLFLERLEEMPVGDRLAPFADGLRGRWRLRRLRRVPAVAVFLLRKDSTRGSTRDREGDSPR